MKTKSIIVVIVLIISFMVCNAQSKKEADFTELESPYLGQNPPGKIAEIFAPEILTFECHDSPIISQDETWIAAGTMDGVKYF